jgi:hypothetical protein
MRLPTLNAPPGDPPRLEAGRPATPGRRAAAHSSPAAPHPA